MKKFNYAILKSPVNVVKQENINGVSLTELLKQQDTLLHFLKNIGIKVHAMSNQSPTNGNLKIKELVLTTRKCAVFLNFDNPDLNNMKVELAVNLSRFYPLDRIHYISFPAIISNRDILVVNDIYYVSISPLTNMEGANKLKEILGRYGFKVVIVENSIGSLADNLNYIEYNNLLIREGFIMPQELREFNLIKVDLAEENGLGALWVNDTIIIPNNCSQLKFNLNTLNKYIIVGMSDSEFVKLGTFINNITLMF